MRRHCSSCLGGLFGGRSLVFQLPILLCHVYLKLYLHEMGQHVFSTWRMHLLQRFPGLQVWMWSLGWCSAQLLIILISALWLPFCVVITVLVRGCWGNLLQLLPSQWLLLMWRRPSSSLQYEGPWGILQHDILLPWLLLFVCFSC